MEASLLERLYLLPPQADPQPQPEALLAAGAYLTDETRLYRCVPTEDPAAVLLEDCLTLELIHCYFDEVATMRLVRPGAP